MSTLPFKLNQAGRHHISKQTHRVTNWPAYDASLRQRGSLTVWVTDEAIQAWAAEVGSRGGQPRWAAEVGSGVGQPRWAAEVGSRGGQPRWAAEVGSRGGQPRWAAEVGSRGGQPRWAAEVGSRGGQPRWAAEVGSRGGQPRWAAEVGSRGVQPRWAAEVGSRGEQPRWAAEVGSRGGQPWDSPLAILTALTLRAVFRLALRQTEGLIGSGIHLLGLDLASPDHTTLSRRAVTLEVPRPRSGSTAEPVHLLVDSTGLKLCGPGEWLVEKHGTRRRRSWRELHILEGLEHPRSPGRPGSG